MGGVHFLRVVVLLIHVFLHTQAYTISSETCQNWGPEQLDLTTWLQEAMEEAKSMATLGKSFVLYPWADPLSNSHEQMLPGLGEADLLEIKGTRVTTIHSRRKFPLRTRRLMVGVQDASD
jgi:hypothetical protein